jgi:hypothetical protein
MNSRRVKRSKELVVGMPWWVVWVLSVGWPGRLLDAVTEQRKYMK